MPTKIRPLHFVFKIGNRAKTMAFYRNLLGMKILRHEEFSEGCNAMCNGPYDGKWSKTMVGYGDESSNFVVELTYNYGIREYDHGNDFNFLKIDSSDAVKRIKEQSEYEFKESSDGYLEIRDSNGYKFLFGGNKNNRDNAISGVGLFVSDLNKAKAYWSDILKGKLSSSQQNPGQQINLSFDFLDFFNLSLFATDSQIDHAKAYGRIAFSCPTEDLKPLQEQIEQAKCTIIKPYIQLDTPGKATVSVVILADPDGHEICFVGDLEFRELSKVDPNGEKLLDEAIASDKSDEWHERQNKKKLKLEEAK